MPVTPKDSPVTVETFADVLKLLQVERLDVDQVTQNLAVEGTNRILIRYGSEWITKHRIRLIEELKYINEQ